MRQDFVYAIHVPWNAFLLSSIWHIETQLNTTVSEKATLTFDSQARAQIIPCGPVGSPLQLVLWSHLGHLP